MIKKSIAVGLLISCVVMIGCSAEKPSGLMPRLVNSGRAPNLVHPQFSSVKKDAPGDPDAPCVNSAAGCVSPPSHGGATTGGGVGGGGSTTVGRYQPKEGEGCWSSPGVLGANIPQSSASNSTEIINIYVLQANNSGGQLDAVGWIYKTPGGWYIQENLQFSVLAEQVLSVVPGIGPLVTALENNHGGIAPLSSPEVQDIAGYMQGHDGKYGSCFTSSLPLG